MITISYEEVIKESIDNIICIMNIKKEEVESVFERSQSFLKHFE